MWRLDVSSEAELEIFEAALRHERERADLGFRFEAQVNRVFARLVAPSSPFSPSFICIGILINGSGAGGLGERSHCWKPVTEPN